MPVMKIAHLTSVHPRYDTRIFLKQCRSLAAAGYDVSLVVADGLGDEQRDGVTIYDAGASKGRAARMIGATRRVLKRGLALDADAYHLHDPELLPVALAFKRRGKRVIFDSHEDVPRQILSKPYLHIRLRRPIATVVGLIESVACRRIDAVVAATPAIGAKFAGIGVCVSVVNNFPMLGELDAELPWSEKANEVCYVGSIAATRGVRDVVAAMALCDSGARLNLAGGFEGKDLRSELESMPGWSKVNALDYLTRSGVRAVLARSVAGLVTLHPTPAYIDALPVKMFEYMSAGVPVIASDFPLWREIILGNDCGVCVDPKDPLAIATAIDRLARSPDVARHMGENGRRAVKERYNWQGEEKTLLSLYDGLLQGA